MSSFSCLSVSWKLYDMQIHVTTQFLNGIGVEMSEFGENIDDGSNSHSSIYPEECKLNIVSVKCDFFLYDCVK